MSLCYKMCSNPMKAICTLRSKTYDDMPCDPNLVSSAFLTLCTQYYRTVSYKECISRKAAKERTTPVYACKKRNENFTAVVGDKTS